MKSRNRGHVQPFPFSLQWSPRTELKMSTMHFNTFTSSSPVYLAQLLTAYTLSTQLRSSSDIHTCSPQCLPRKDCKTLRCYGLRGRQNIFKKEEKKWKKKKEETLMKTARSKGQSLSCQPPDLWQLSVTAKRQEE